MGNLIFDFSALYFKHFLIKEAWACPTFRKVSVTQNLNHASRFYDSGVQLS